MSSEVPGSRTPEESVFVKLANQLRTETSAETIVENLWQLNKALQDEIKDEGLLLFVRAGGLPDVIRLLRGPAPSDSGATADGMPLAVSQQAEKVLAALLCSDSGMAEVGSAKDIIPALVDALGDAPDYSARAMAAHALMVIAQAQPTGRKAIAEAGVMSLLVDLLTFWEDLGRHAEKVEPARALAQTLLYQERAAMRDLQLVICGPEAERAFTALLLLQVLRLY